MTDSNIIILDNPTQGVDIGAKAEIYQLIGQLAEQGKAIVVLSSEVPEILKICNRVYVMHRGTIVAPNGRNGTLLIGEPFSEPHSFVEQVNSSGWGCAGSTGFVNNDTLMKDI
jgi:ABC-type multidrug transport system ATPase subunit